ncbi:MAG TPA: ATP-dependent DNA ligase [Blastocatellia bacterium]|nr:ATP-dependent DNA ligase [Blastocatellia bacterium]
MRFDELANYLEKLETASGRATMYDLLGALYEQAATAELAPIAYLMEAQLAPAFAGVQIGMGERMVANAIAEAAGKSAEQVNKLSKKQGDLGLVAEALLPARPRSRLTVLQAYERLLDIAQTSGSGSTEKKIQKLAALLKVTAAHAARYLVRLAVGRLRLGVGTPTIIEAVARTQADRRAARDIIERAYNLCSDLGLVLKTLRERGLDGLKRFKVRVGNPVRMMLAERLPDAEAIFKKLGRCAVEAKLDGFRCQVHWRAGRAEIFSRNLERLTDMFPDIAAAVAAQINARTAIIEGEAMAFNEATGEFYPFQVTVQRKRKHKIAEKAEAMPLAFVVFDVLYADGKDQTGKPYDERRALLEKLIRFDGHIRPVDREIAESAEAIQEFFDEQVGGGQEGIIAKRLDSTYQAGGRNYNWIKLKRNYGSELTDTIDAVIVGYLRGRGQRARLGIGALLAAVYDEASDTFKTIGKVGSGLSEANWIKLRKLLDKQAADAKPARVDSRLMPDVWVEPSYLVTILADEITRSPVHTAALDQSGKGLALRFPRVVGFIREDKSPEDATTVEEIQKMFAMQKRH